MTALTTNKERPHRNAGVRRTYPVAAAERIFNGALVMIDVMADSVAYAREAVASATNRGCVGVATAEVNNTSGGSGALNVTVLEAEFLFAATTVSGGLGSLAYAEDDNTVDETQASNEPVAGVITGVTGASECWVAVSAANAKL